MYHGRKKKRRWQQKNANNKLIERGRKDFDIHPVKRYETEKN
jgi:hypothetical protein